MKLENILIFGLIILVFASFLLIPFFSKDNIASTILGIIQSLILATTIYFIYQQAKSAERMNEIASRPHISVGIMSLKDGSLDKIFAEPYNQELEDTRIILKNFSNFPAFVWTKLKLEINGKEENKHIKIKDYCFAKATWEIDPNGMLFPFILEKSILDHKHQEINISIQVYFSSIRKLPKEPDWIELTAYSFRREERQWLKNNLGVPFFIQGLFPKIINL